MKMIVTLLNFVLCYSCLHAQSFYQPYGSSTNMNPYAPEIKWESTIADYGTLNKGDESQAIKIINFKNVGQTTLIISSCRGSCGCLVPTCPTDPIQPGGNAQISVHYDVNRVGPFTKAVTVTSNAKNPNEVITVKGVVVDWQPVATFTPGRNENANPSSEPVKPAILSVSDVKFTDENHNEVIDGNENCQVCFTVQNGGKGASQSLRANAANVSSIKGITTEGTYIGSVDPGATKKACVTLKGSYSLSSGMALVKISFEEKNGFQPDAVELSIQTREFLKPEIAVVDYSFLSDNGAVRLGLPVQLKALVQNIGQGIGYDVAVQFTYPQPNVFPNGEYQFSLGTLKPGEKKELLFEFIANKLYTAKDIPLTIKCTEKHGLYGEQKSVSAAVNSALSSSTITISGSATAVEKISVERASLSADVDKNIPVSQAKKTNAYALVIGNEDYSRYQTGLANEANVEFARNDATVFAQYAEKTLGIPVENIVLLTDAISSKMRAELERVVKMAVLSKGEIYFYYAGHGLPDEVTKVPYIIPVDIAGSDIQSAIKLSEVYNKLGSPDIQKATVFLDACFSGGGRNEGLIAARAVKIAPKVDALPANVAVFAAASGTQMSFPYKEKQHGIFTYYLLKKLQESKGDLTLKDLGDYLKQQVELQSLKVNRMEQSPNLAVGNGGDEHIEYRKN